MQPSDFPVIAVTSGMSGFFAVLYWWNPEDGGFPEPYSTGFGRYPMTTKGALDAIDEAKHWAEAEEIRLDPAVLQHENRLRQLLVAAERNSPFDMVAGQTNPNEDVP